MKRNRQAGQALVFVTFGLVALIGVVGLSIDMGYLRYTKRRLQTAADSAAIAGASVLKDPNRPYQSAAFNDAKSNGFEDGVNGVTVTPHNPPIDPVFLAKTNALDYVEVQVQQDAPTFFMRIFGVKQALLSATAVAQLGSSRGCIYSLALLGGITVNGTVTAPGCGVVDNATLSISGGCLTASSIGLVLQLLGGGCTSPPPIQGIAPSADPLAYLAAPAPPACKPLIDVNSIGNPQNPNTPPTPVPPVLPDVYCGIRIRPTNRAPVTFQPGVYMIQDGPGGVGLQIDAAGAPVNGDGVTFYVTGKAPVNVTGNVTLTAPTNSPVGGVPGGVLFFQDRANGQAATINGTLTGALYFPNAQVTMSGNGTTPYTIVVAQTITFNGTIGIGSDYTSLPEGSPIKAAVLVR
jgi:hypothetical protein